MRAIRALTGIQTQIKWVNDLYYNEKKICGILTEAVSAGEHTHVIVGIGINLDTADFPEELSGIAGSHKSTVRSRSIYKTRAREIGSMITARILWCLDVA